MWVSKEGFHQLLVKFFLVVEEVPAEVSIASRGNTTAENQWRMNVLIALLWQCQCQCLVPFLSLYCQNSAIIKHYSHQWKMTLYFTTQTTAICSWDESSVIWNQTKTDRIVSSISRCEMNNFFLHCECEKRSAELFAVCHCLALFER